MNKYIAKFIKTFVSTLLVTAILLPSLPESAKASDPKPLAIEKDVLWDLDFEDETTRKSKSTVVLCDSDGNSLKNHKGNIFSTNTGSPESNVSIVAEDSGDNKVLCLETANSTDLVQTNDFFCTVSEEIFVLESKVKVPDFNTDKVLFWLVYEDEKGVTRWSQSFRIAKTSSDTSVFRADGVTKTIPCKKNEWYDYKVSLDLDTDILEFFVDGECLDEAPLAHNATKTVRVSVRCAAGNISKMYLDDIKVTNATHNPFSKLELLIDGKESLRISKGTLGIKGTMSPGYEKSDCIIALYDKDVLKKVKWIKNASESPDAPTYINEENFADVDLTSSVKMIVLKSGTMVPYGKCVLANKNGVSSQMLNIKDCESIFSSESATKKLVSGMVCYHPSSGLLTIDNVKKQTDYVGEMSDEVLMVPVNLLGEIDGMSVTVSSDRKSATVNGYTFTEGLSFVKFGNGSISIEKAPCIKNGLLYVPFKDIVEKLFQKYFYSTNEGINSGAVIISDSAFTLSSENVQTVNDYLLYERPSGEKVLADYKASGFEGVHPRVIMTSADFERVKNATDAKSVEQKQKLIANADSILNQKILIYELRDGVRLWYVSMDFMDRVMTLAFAYKLTGNTKYFDRCIAEMDSIASFPDWHPEHHIDVGGLAVGFAIGYDWLYHDLNETQRAKYEASVYDLCYDLYYKGFTNNSKDMKNGIIAGNNHNSVMNSGITMCAVAFMDVYPELGAYFISNALKATEITVKNFFPDGSWYEGIHYACMTLEYLSLQLSAMENVFGTCYGIDASEGMEDSADFIVNMQSTTGAFSFYDGGSNALQWHSGTLWFADHFGKDGITALWRDEYEVEETMRGVASSLMYFNPEANPDFSQMEKDVFYKENDVIILRDSWTADAPTFVGAKGGMPSAPHGHMDMGTFTFYSNGVRWLTDYGAEGYNLPNYWQGTTTDGGRWQYFALRGEAHNCLVINPGEHGEFDAKVHADFTRFESGENGAISVLDMTDSHYGKASSAKRGFFFTDNRKSLVVRDELSLSEESDVYWFLQTEHQVTIDGNTVKIKDKNSSKYITVEILSNKDFTLEASTPEPLPTSPHPNGLKSLAGKTRIMLKTKASGNVNITAKLTPYDVSGSDTENYNTDIANWKLQ
ncbi:MAG: heparinase II/III family protein [Clostridia bacterium]|nr:heparinase II/III family protein [Clostridia bacterium]